MLVPYRDANRTVKEEEGLQRGEEAMKKRTAIIALIATILFLAAVVLTVALCLRLPVFESPAVVMLLTILPLIGIVAVSLIGHFRFHQR